MKKNEPGKTVRGWSDIRAKNKVEENIFVFAPAKKLQQLERSRTPTFKDLEELYHSVMEQELVHAGNLNFHHIPDSKMSNLWWWYVGCNAPVKFKSLWRDDLLDNWGTQICIICPQCGIRVGSRLTSGEFSHLMFNLMVKNVLPETSMGNIINPSYQEWLISFSREDRDILKTGKHNSEKCKDIPPPFFRPGFLYAVNPDHCNFFPESPDWLKLLFMKYKEQVDQLLQKSFRDIGGPRRK